MITITFQRPYTGTWATQSFPTKEQAESMVAFYLSCGSKARLL